MRLSTVMTTLLSISLALPLQLFAAPADDIFEPPAAPAAATPAPAPPTPAPATSRKSEISEILDSMGYPELQVVPRATERLAIESKYEDSNVLIMHWPIELAGMFTLLVGVTSNGFLRDNLNDTHTAKP